MSVIDEVLAANEIYARTHELSHLTPRPARKMAMLTCMDTRLSILTLGLKTGDAHIIRNAGGIVTDDTLRSLVISHHLLGHGGNHGDQPHRLRVDADQRSRTCARGSRIAPGPPRLSPAFFYAFQDIDENVRQQLQKLTTHPWIPKTVAARGFVYDVTTGLLREIKPA